MYRFGKWIANYRVLVLVLAERLKAAQELSGQYRSFAGTGVDNGSVQFSLRTESIGE